MGQALYTARDVVSRNCGIVADSSHYVAELSLMG